MESGRGSSTEPVLQRVSPLPNIVTVARLVASVACVAAIQLAGPSDAPDETAMLVAFVLFVVAASSDWVDGWLARRLDAVTQFGRIADPLVDKVLVLGVLVVLLRIDVVRALLPAWIVAVLVVREVVVTTVRAVAEGEGHAFAADRLGKWKMVAQSVLAALLLAGLAAGMRTADLDAAGTGSASLAGRTIALTARSPVIPVLVLATLVLTVVSGIGYVVRAWRMLSKARMRSG